MQVIKRNGELQEFDFNKIKNAIEKAFIATGRPGVPSILFENLEHWFNLIADGCETTTVEKIQDIVEKHLMFEKYFDVAKAYILYRAEHSKIRDGYSELLTKIYDRLHATNVENANANVDENTFSGREKEASSDLQKYLAFNAGGVSKLMADCHNEMIIYQHDAEKTLLGQHNCLFENFNELFTNGFSTRNGDVRPPSTYSTACQLVAVAFQCQSQVQFGGVASAHIDFDLSPFVLKSFIKYYNDGLKWIKMYPELDFVPESIEDPRLTSNKIVYEYAMNMLEREGKQSTEALFHNLNTLESRQGSQVPFTSLNYGRDTTPEGRLVTKWMLEASIAGVGKHHLTPIFPISIFQYKQGNNANSSDPNYDLKQLALKSMARRIYPNWANCDWSEAHEDLTNPDTYFATMGCRTLIGYDRHGLGYTRVGRGNNVPNTIILPKLGIEYGICLGKREQPDLDGFWKALDDTMKKCEKTLLERFTIMRAQSPKAAPFMYKNGTIQDGKNCDDTVYNALKHNTLAMGYIGIAEMCQALFGKNHAEDPAVHEFALSVIKRMSAFVKECAERNDLNFSLYATPAEGLCRTALVALRNQYGVIENVTSREYLTNSHHVPVWMKVSINEKLKLEAPFCKYPTGGCITYVELESSFVNNRKAIESIIDYAFKELDIPYLAFNFPIDSCLDCGHQGEFNDQCPECESHHICQLRRVTGYLTADYKTGFNKGKVAEVEDRVKHSKYE